MIILDLMQDVAILLALCFVQRFISRRWQINQIQGKLASGLLFGLVCVVAMNAAITLIPGVIFDARNVVLSMAALFGGPLVAVIAGTIAGAWRLILGGAGALIGAYAILSSILIGLIFHHYYRKELAQIGIRALLTMGLLIQITTIMWFYFLPVDFVNDILLGLAPPYILILTIATILLGLLLRDVERIRQFDFILDEARDQFKVLFNSATISIWEEDISGVIKHLEQLRNEGVDDLRRYLHQHPDQVSHLLDMIRVKHLNPATLKLFSANSAASLLKDIKSTFTPAARSTFIEALAAIWDKQQKFTAQTSFRKLDGTILECIISMPIPKMEAASRHVPVSIIDITSQKNTERQLLQKQQRLDEIIRATDAGIWEWNVQTGEMIVNERWAGLTGYTLEEISPVTIETWYRLVHPDDRIKSDQQLDQLFSRKIDFYQCEVRLRHKLGHWVWILDRGNVSEWLPDGRPFRVSGTHIDINTRKLAELHAQRLSHLRETMLLCHKVIVLKNDETTLLQKMVEILVDNHGYVLVWIGIPQQDESHTIIPVAKAGKAINYLDDITIHWSEDEFSRGPTGMAINTGKVQSVSEIAGTESFRPWMEQAAAYDIKASIALPLFVHNKVFAALNVYSILENSFDDEETGLLTEFASTLGLAVQSLRAENENQNILAELNQAALGTINAVAATIEKRDPYTSGHQQKVALLSVAIASRLGWDKHRIEGLRLGAMIHDIGKIYIPAEILNRPGKLSDAEFELIKSHPQVGYDILENSNFPWPIKQMILQHHERLDGSGYPNRLKGEQIIEEARIIAVADVVEAITSHRPYRPGRGLDIALKEIRQGKGNQYDTKVVDTCLDLFEKDAFKWE